jgi:hypothetical protein
MARLAVELAMKRLITIARIRPQRAISRIDPSRDRSRWVT